MRIFMTGTSGFLGRPVAGLLLAAGHAVAALARPGRDRASLAEAVGGMLPIVGTLDETAGLRAPLADFAPDMVIHSGWSDVGGAGRNSPGQMRNAVMTANLAQLAVDVGVRSFIGIGSQAEYGVMDKAVDEAEPTRPVTLYGIAKLAAALASRQICAGADVRWAWLRLFSAYGPRDHPTSLVSTLGRQLTAGERPALTACEQRWDFLHIDDAAEAVVAAAMAPSAAGMFNLGSGVAPPLRETVELLRDLIDPALPLGFGQLPYGPYQTMHLQADIRRLSEATGWRPRIPLREGLISTLRWQTGQEWSRGGAVVREG